MKNLSIKVAIVGLSFGAFACGSSYPFSMQRDLQRSDEARKASDDENAQLKAKNQTYVDYLQNMYTTDHYNWVWANAFATYAAAEATCSSIGYSVPDQAAYDEFISELYNNKADWKAKVRPEQIHVSGVTTALQNGFVLCGKTKN